MRADFCRGAPRGCNGGGPAANGLDDERDYVEGGEDDDVHSRGEEGGATADDADEGAEGDVGGCGEEDGRDDEGGDLHQEVVLEGEGGGVSSSFDEFAGCGMEVVGGRKDLPDYKDIANSPFSPPIL